MKSDKDAVFLDNLQKSHRTMRRASIRESECIGCTKCIQACPVDAIMGSAKVMHAVITKECTGCELCVAPCPVDCIDMVESQEISTVYYHLERYHARKKRISLEKNSENVVENRKDYIREAVLRVKEKKNSQ